VKRRERITGAIAYVALLDIQPIDDQCIDLMKRVAVDSYRQA